MADIHCLVQWLMLPLVFREIGGETGSDQSTPTATTFLQDDQEITIFSSYFPYECCDDKTFLIKYIGSKHQYIRLEFTDIDIPLGSAILFRGSDDEVLPDQLRLVGKSYIRKGFAFNRSTIKVLFQPVARGLSPHYTGFRAKVWTTSSLPYEWEYWPTSGACQPASDVMLGGILQLKDKASIYQQGVRSLPNMPMHDCIWLIKLPGEFKGSGHNVKLFVRFDEMAIDHSLKPRFELIVNEDNSQGKKLKKFGEFSSDIKNGTNPVVITSNHDLYVRLKLPYTTKTGTSEEHYILRITYGIYAETTSTSSECSFGHLSGFNCKEPQWCVPVSYKCDGMVHCASYEDEIESTCVGSKVAESPAASPTD